MHESLCYTKQSDLYINCEAIESLSIEIRNNDGKNIIFNIVYRPPNGDLEVCENYFQSILSHSSIRNKNVIFAGDFNIIVLDFEQNKMVKDFVNLMFQFGLVPTRNKPTRVTNKTISAIDHIITNFIYNNDFKTGIIKTDISDHSPIIYAFKLRSSMSSENHPKNRYLHKRIINESSKATFKRRLRETSWDAVKGLDNPNESYVKFLETTTQIYDDCFQKTKFKIKSNNKANPWITPQSLLNENKNYLKNS